VLRRDRQRRARLPVYGRQYHTASYAIDNGERLAGKLATIKEWIARNKVVLLAARAETQAGKYPERMICELRENI
jgi:hypothetical protein